ncbi:sensor histidine kinase [Egbenema bharatensis]|uniref:sensor histidine kinase n=1 Tax=Egbenema bharatensis TaxID=3463334 RepID=UPI003A8BA6CB
MAAKYPWWHWFLGETRTRILLLYTVLMLLVTAASVPIFLLMLFANISQRAQAELNQEMQSFRSAQREWESLQLRSDRALYDFLDDYLAQQMPEEEHFLIAIVDEQLYHSNPSELPPVLEPGSSLSDRWMNIGHSVSGRQRVSGMGDILYSAQPLILRDRIRGSFVVVQQTAGKRQEALDGIVIFVQVAIGVILISFVLAWFATARILSPMKQLVSAARSINESDLTRRIPSMKGSGEMTELAEAFNAMMNRLQEAFISQRDFVNDAGHELRTPITIIQGHLELLGDDPQERQETLDLVMDELDRMSRMVNDLILLAKAERPDFLHLETIDIPAFMEDLFSKAQTLADRVWVLQSSGKGRMVGDRQRLTGAILNLIQNATHYTKSTDLIELGYAITRKEVRFWVRDTGEGIAPEDQKRIFERFARAANSYRRSEGAGLGLAIVRAITEAHGGRVELMSQLEIGSTFMVILPLEPNKKRLFT